MPAKVVGDNDRDRGPPSRDRPLEEGRGCLTNEQSRFRPTWQCPSLSLERRAGGALHLGPSCDDRGKELVRETEKTKDAMLVELTMEIIANMMLFVP